MYVDHLLAIICIIDIKVAAVSFISLKLPEIIDRIILGPNL